MKVYVLTSVKMTDGVLISYQPQVFKKKEDAFSMLRRIKEEEYIPEYVEIRGYKVCTDLPEMFTASRNDDCIADSLVTISVTCTEIN